MTSSHIETTQPSAANPLAACLEPSTTLVVAETALGEARLRQVAALARVMDVTLALRGPGASALAATLGCASTAPPEPAPPSSAPALTVREIIMHRLALPLTDLYVSSMYLTPTQSRVVVEIRTHQGLTGWGESHATALPRLQALAKTWLGKNLAQDMPALRRAFGRIGFDNRDGRNALSAFAGLELAAWDLQAQAAGQPLHRLLGHQGPTRPMPIACPLPAAVPGSLVTRTELAAHMADLGNTQRVVELALSFKQRFGINAFKYKSAGNTPAWDITTLKALRAALGPQSKIRFDPNAAYSTHAARELCEALDPIGLEFLEDPTDGLEGLARLSAHVRTPFATNMCVIAPEHLAAAYRRGLSVTVLGDVFLWGGVEGLRQMALAARALGHRPAVHSFYESGVVTAANCHLALALGTDQPHPMDCGWPGLAADITPPFAVSNGHILCPEGPGLGVMPEATALKALANADPIHLH